MEDIEPPGCPEPAKVVIVSMALLAIIACSCKREINSESVICKPHLIKKERFDFFLKIKPPQNLVEHRRLELLTS